MDDYHGTAVADPYRWMESLDAPEVAEWVRAQNAVTRPWLDALPLREHFGARLTALWDYPRTGLPVLEAGQLFYARNAGLERQAPLYRRDPTTGTVSLILDPNAISADGGVSLASWRVAPDGRHLAYGLATGGADWRTLKVVQAEARTILSIELTVTFDESQGANSTGRLTSMLVADGSDGGDLRLVASADALGFSGIRDAAGWPPDVPGYFDGGLDLYRADLTVRFSDGTRADTRVRSIAVTDVAGRYYLFAPIAGAGEPIPGAHRVLRAFDADNVGICALARHEVDELGRE